jgi:hypothetical protein
VTNFSLRGGCLERAACSAGASDWTTLRAVTLPLLQIRCSARQTVHDGECDRLPG